MSNLFEVATSLAERKHSGQFRRDGKTPSVDHVKAVADAMEGDDAKTVAILHRLLEDTATTIAELEAIFPRSIVAQVFLLTRREGQCYDEYARQVAGSDIACSIKKVAIEKNLEDAPTESQVQNYAVATALFETGGIIETSEAKIQIIDIESQYVGEELYIPACEGEHTGGLATVTYSEFDGKTRRWFVRFGAICKLKKFDYNELKSQQAKLGEQYTGQIATAVSAETLG